ncbi:MAG TPA: hypothetical protein VK530_04175 [Candidatus Acidoferrum sp.]|nr:hypothetical protein [Candidatus Acidoferrum sp.]
MTPQRRKALDEKCSEFHELVTASKDAGKLVTKVLGAMCRLMSHAYPSAYDPSHRDIRVTVREFCDHEHAPAGAVQSVQDMLEQYEEAVRRNRAADQAWRKADEELQQVADDELSGEFISAFSERIDAMQKFLVSTLKPFCSDERELNLLLDHVPRYQQLLLDRKYGRNGSTGAGRVSAMLSALAKLERSKTTDLATIKL